MGTSAVSVAVSVAADWGTGRTMDLVITNTGKQALSTWSVTMPWSGTSIEMWNANATLSGGKLTAANAGWNGALAPGASTSVGFNDAGALVSPSTCTSIVDGRAAACSIKGAGSGSSPTPTATPTPTPTATPTPTPTGPALVGSKKVIGYYPGWATYARNYQVSDIPGNKVSHLNYAFANIAGGKCVLGDSYADTDKAFAGDTWDTGVLRGNFNQLIKLRNANPALKTLISIGGWTWSANFSAAAASDASRQAFASSCVDFMKQYKFDGIDIDWEYPVSGGLQSGAPEDKQNFTLLLKELRVQMNAKEATDNRDYFLTIAAPAGPSVISNLEVKAVGDTLDWINLMTYDYHGGWDPMTGHNAPMVQGARDPGPKGFAIKDTVNSYLTAGVPASKLVLGVPFYGRGWQQVAETNGGLFQSGTGAGVGTWENGVFDYTDIKANYLPTMQRYWDSEAQVPYLYDRARGLFISYDDPQSMKIKADYINAMGLGGAMIWELSGDRNAELLDALNTTLN